MLSTLSLTSFKLILLLAFSSPEVAERPLHEQDSLFASTEEVVEMATAVKELQLKYAEQLKVGTEVIQHERLYSFIDEWLGTSYRYGGKSKSGTDCSGFANILFKEIYHLELLRSSASIFTQVKAISKDSLQEGDLVFFKIRKNRISHVGVYLHNNYFVHASTQSGVIISSLDEPYYKKYFYKGGRIEQNEG